MCRIMSVPHSPSPDWAVSKLETFMQHNDDPIALEAVLELLAACCASKSEDKFKHEAAWAAIDHGYCGTDDCKRSARRYFAAA